MYLPIEKLLRSTTILLNPETAQVKSHYATYTSGAYAQNLVFTTGYSQTEQSFILDLEAGSLSEAGQQETEPNLTFMDISGKNFQYSYPISFRKSLLN
jgi:hypothetical protein